MTKTILATLSITTEYEIIVPVEDDFDGDPEEYILGLQSSGGLEYLTAHGESYCVDAQVSNVSLVDSNAIPLTPTLEEEEAAIAEFLADILGADQGCPSCGRDLDGTVCTSDDCPSRWEENGCAELVDAPKCPKCDRWLLVDYYDSTAPLYCFVCG